MLKRNKRIHGRDAIALIVKEGTRTPGRLLTTIKKPNEATWNRYAVVVSKKIEKSAAKRNRKRRQVYEIIRLLEQTKPMAFGPFSDIVLLVRPAGLTASFPDLQKTLSTLL